MARPSGCLTMLTLSASAEAWGPLSVTETLLRLLNGFEASFAASSTP